MRPEATCGFSCRRRFNAADRSGKRFVIRVTLFRPRRRATSVTVGTGASSRAARSALSIGSHRRLLRRLFFATSARRKSWNPLYKRLLLRSPIFAATVLRFTGASSSSASDRACSIRSFGNGVTGGREAFLYHPALFSTIWRQRSRKRPAMVRHPIAQVCGDFFQPPGNIGKERRA